MTQSDALTFYRFCRGYACDGTDLADLCSEIRVDREAPSEDGELLRHLKRIMVDDQDLVRRLWLAYRKALRREARLEPAGGRR